MFAIDQTETDKRPENLDGGIFLLVVTGLRYYTPRLGRWVSRDPIGDFAEALYLAFRADPVNRYDALGNTAVVTQLPTNLEGDSTSPDWRTIEPSGQRAGGFTSFTIDTPDWNLDRLNLTPFCRLSNSGIKGTSKITIDRNVNANASMGGDSGRTLLEHEQRHVHIFKASLVDYDASISPYMSQWKTCCCIESLYKWTQKRWTYLSERRVLLNWRLECSDYSEGIDKTHACNVKVPQHVTAVSDAAREDSRAFDEMQRSCNF